MRDKDTLTLSTVRLILARLKERDIEVRPKGNADGIADAEIQQMLQGMIKQRRESIELYDKGSRPELADKERGEIAIIERFLPKQMSDAEQEAAIKDDHRRDRRRRHQGYGPHHGGAAGSDMPASSTPPRRARSVKTAAELSVPRSFCCTGARGPLWR